MSAQCERSTELCVWTAYCTVLL